MRLTRKAIAVMVVVPVMMWSAVLVGCRSEEAVTVDEAAGQQPVAPPVGAGDVATAPEADQEEVTEVEWQLTSSAFEHGESILKKYTADGGDISPPLEWSEPPEGTAELALICDDPDAPAGVWTHWVLYGLSPEVSSLPTALPTTETAGKAAVKQGLNSWGKVGYGGPSPPPGKSHRYQFTLYALSKKLELEPGAEKQALLDAMKDKVIGSTMLEGTYGR